MHRQGMIAGILGVALMSGAWAQAAETATAPAAGGDLLLQAQALYDQREAGVDNVKKAVGLYQQALAANPKDFSALWKLSQAYLYLGDHAPKADQIKLFDLGKSYGEKASQVDPGKKEGYYWMGVNIGRAAEERGVMNSLFAVDPIAKSMEKALAIDPKDGPAAHVLGVLYRKAPGWPVSRGDMKKSLAYAQQAVADDPASVIHHVGLAETLLALGKKEDAKAELLKALEAPGHPDQQPETKADKETAKKILSALK